MLAVMMIPIMLACGDDNGRHEIIINFIDFTQSQSYQQKGLYSRFVMMKFILLFLQKRDGSFCVIKKRLF